MQAIHQSTNEKVDELEHELRTNESQILQLVDQVLSLTNQISSLMEANEHLTFVQILNLNLKYICQSSVPVNLVLGGPWRIKSMVDTRSRMTQIQIPNRRFH